MPELPEVETVCRGLGAFILNQKITSVVIRNYKLRLPIASDLADILTGQTVLNIQRRGKYILLKMKFGTLIIHLGMSGSLQIKPKEYLKHKHDHVLIKFKNDIELCYNDPRRFGAIIWTKHDPAKHQLLKNLGPEPFAKFFTAKYLYDFAKISRCTIKQFIMNNKIVTGIGNIYASEILFAAKIKPLRKANNISLDEIKLLVKKIKEILLLAIKFKGTTIKDYINSDGRKGSFQNKLQVYGRKEQLCFCCKTKLEYINIGGRATVFCSCCQK
jgi:formamidopyrimidine-DNA glycosylase